MMNSNISFNKDIISDIDCTIAFQFGCLFKSIIKSNIQMSNVKITNVFAKEPGIFYFSKVFFHAENCIFQKLAILENEGAIFLFFSSEIYWLFNEFTYFHSSGLEIVDSLVTINNSIFMKNAIDAMNINKNLDEELPVISLKDCPIFFIYSATFQNNYCSQNGASIKIQYKNDFNGAFQRIFLSKFVNNSVLQNGGAIYSENCHLQLDSNIFLNNSAKFSGGAIHFIGDFNLTLINNSFYENTANEGGALKYDKKIPNFHESSNIFSKNKAIYGENIASYPIRFQIESSIFGKNIDKITLEKRPSNSESIFTNFTLNLIDILNQTVLTIDNEEISIYLNFRNEGLV